MSNYTIGYHDYIEEFEIIVDTTCLHLGEDIERENDAQTVCEDAEVEF